MKILFILKKNMNYNFVSYCRRSSGLWNSTRFIVDGFRDNGIEAEVVEVDDGNDVDREVTKFDPDVVVAEALWVTPDKFKELLAIPRHKERKWFVHMHSGLPFLALEGIAMEWLNTYPSVGVSVIANSTETYDAFRAILPHEFVYYLPNVYIPDFKNAVSFDSDKDTLDIGCFGAIRPMKNQLAQAIAAIEFSNQREKKLKFHMNGSRVEVGGQPVLKNLIQLFEKHPGHELVLHDWMEPEDFIDFLHKNIDLGMQVSMTETFNVVTADYLTAGIPVVVSEEVSWVSSFSMADDNSIESMVKVMHRVISNKFLIKWNQFLLKSASQEAQCLWHSWLRRLLKSNPI